MSTREGGVSTEPFASMNLSGSVGDDPAALAENRRRFDAALGMPVRVPWMVHGAAVARVDAAAPWPEKPQADAVWTTDAGIACGVTAADCLPVLFCSDDGCVVGAAHAGWRGLAAGVLENTVRAMTDGAAIQAAALQAWLGPCIGPRHFEVGADVLAAFAADAEDPPPTFTPHRRADGSRAWLADLPALARARLQAASVERISGGHWCTVAEPLRFFSFRRDRTTGRMLAAIGRIGRMSSMGRLG